jgi:transposase InsO family protein
VLAPSRKGAVKRIKELEVASTCKHDGKITAVASNTYWCSDGFEVECENGESVRVIFVMYCCDREVMNWVATSKGIDTGLVGPDDADGRIPVLRQP